MSAEMDDTNLPPIPPFSTNEGQNASSKMKRRASRPSSVVWSHFTKFVTEGHIKAKCNYCSKEFFADPKKNGTTAMKSHMGVCKNRLNASGDPSQTELVFESGGGDGSLGTWRFNQDVIRKAIAEMVIVDELPFRFVDGKGFRNCMTVACPRFHIPSRWTVARDCFQIYVDEKVKLKQLLNASAVRVSLTTDTWTSLQRINYMCLTAHFIDNDWKLHKRIINFCPISSHRGEAIGKAIERCLRDWGIDKVFTITVDNATSNDVAISYLMLDTAQKFEKAFEAFDDVDPYYKSELMMGDGLPEKEDWENVRRFCLFLHKFYELTIKVSGSSYVTSNNFLDDICNVYTTLRNWQINPDLQLSAMANRMRAKFDKYWGNVEKMNMLIYVASILDPRKKLEFVRFCFLEMYDIEQVSLMISNVKKGIEELFGEYKRRLQPQGDQVSESSQIRQIMEEDNREVLLYKFKRYKKEIGKEENKTELDRYLDEEDSGDFDSNFNVLIWWKVNCHRFPILSNMARDVLAAPISTVASESAFSTGGRVLDAYRSSLTPRLVQALICAQDWLRGSPTFNDIEDDLVELEKVDLDLSKIAFDTSFD